jgi:hypothetical protein
MSIASIKVRANCIVAFVSIFLLLASFGLHAIQVPHSHANEQSDEHSTDNKSSVFVSLGEYMHGAENKFFILIDSALIVCTKTIELLFGTFSLYLASLFVLYALLFRNNTHKMLRIENHIRFLLAQGILNPKLY